MIPLNQYQPEQNAIEFRVNLEDGGVDYTEGLLMMFRSLTLM
jgi:hypothetical protein